MDKIQKGAGEMNGEKEERKVNITCQDNSLLKGFIIINKGESLLDFLNNTKEDFLSVKNAEFYSIKEIRSFRLIDEIAKRENIIVLNKSSIKLAEEF